MRKFRLEPTSLAVTSLAFFYSPGDNVEGKDEGATSSLQVSYRQTTDPDLWISEMGEIYIGGSFDRAG